MTARRVLVTGSRDWTDTTTIADTIRNELGIQVDHQLVNDGDPERILDALYRTGYWAGHEAVMDQVGGR